ncbi:MAG: 4Fe-4S binding protein [Pseudomonadota bacterium]
MHDRVDLGKRPRAYSYLPVLLLLLALILQSAGALGATRDHLQRFLPKTAPGEILPGADDYGPPQGDPPVVQVLKDGLPVGTAFLNSSFANAAGYSGKPIHIMIGLDLEGRITGLKLVDHKEPIVLVGIPESKIVEVLDSFVGLDVPEFVRTGGADHEVDIVSGATVTVMVADDSILRAAIKVARRLGLGGLKSEPATARGPRWRVNSTVDEVSDWATLTGEGAVRRLQLSVAEVTTAFSESGEAVAAARPEADDQESTFIDLYAAVVSIPSVGRSLLGEAEYGNLRKALKPDQEAILVAANGLYSFKGSGYVRGGIFDRFQVIQGDESLRFRDRDHKRLGAIAAAGAPKFKDVDLFITPEGLDFDPARGWRLELLAARATGPTTKAFLTFDLGYRPPERYLEKVAKTDSGSGQIHAGQGAERHGAVLQGEPLWQRLWRDKLPEVVVLLTALGVLTLIFYVQDWLTKRVALTERLRIGFLIFTLFGLGFYANAQLSVVNIMTFFNALVVDFRWDFFLKDPLIFILWGSVAAALLFWGRGAFCGWLCPFGALQELTNKLAKLCKVPQVKVPWWLHERLWSLKYMIFLVLFGVSLYSLALAEQMAEIEPFKTAIILKFQRDWPFVAFAVALLVAGLFIERFYCRYLCPLGAALAIPGRLRMFDWLKRYRECGNPCQRCGTECMVGAIHPQGQINPNECHSCLHCQTLYHDDRRCPVMIQRRLKRERRQALASKNLPPKRGEKPKKALELADFLPE